MPARVAVSIVSVALVAGMGASVPASSAVRDAVGCVLIRDQAADQALVNSGVPNGGMGPTSLDIRSLRVAVSRKEIALSWLLSDLVRPTAPGESFNYRFEFTNAEATYFLHAQIQALASPSGTPITDRFVFGQQGDAISGAIVSSTAVPGRFDAQHNTVSIQMPARLVGRPDLSRFAMQPAKAYTDRELGSTLGLVSDALDYFPPGRYSVSTRKGC